jgi:DnaK suppressor protein
MNKKEAQKFKKLLQSESDRLSAGLRRLEQDNLYNTVTENTADIANAAEVGTDNFEYEVALNIASNETDMLRDINDALRRVDSGSYGVCEGCNVEIPRKRLEVFPAAKFCIECQSKLERRGYI